MKPREMSSPATMAVPPPHLRQFTDPARPGHQGEDLGVNVYQDRDAWLAARREWEAARGLTLKQWEQTMVDELLAEHCTLAELNDSARFMIEDDDFTDPRLTAA